MKIALEHGLGGEEVGDVVMESDIMLTFILIVDTIIMILARSPTITHSELNDELYSNRNIHPVSKPYTK